MQELFLFVHDTCSRF